VTQRLAALLNAKEITYDLLKYLFKANTLVFTTCLGSKTPRCIRYESGEEEVTATGLQYFHIKGNYLEFDGKVLGKAPVETAILRFPGSKRISSLEAFPLYYHEAYATMREDLIERGRKFCSLTGAQHRQYKGKAFEMKKGQPFRKAVDSRIMVDAAMFQDINPNYTRPSIFKNSRSKDLWEIFDEQPTTELDESILKTSIDIHKLNDEQLQLCSPTVLGFSLNDMQWRKYHHTTIINFRLTIPK
jgi:hypothetical protein